MWDDVDEAESGYYEDHPDHKPTLAEVKLAAELVVFIEHELNIDVTRLRVRVRENIAYIQGSVSSREEREEIERNLPSRPKILGIETAISINAND